MTSWLGWLRDLPAQPAALVGVLATEGSAPRGPGTWMLVTANGQRGTIGGGALEHRAAKQARAILTHPPGSYRIQDYPLGPMLGQCCGGRVRLLIEHVDPRTLGWLNEANEDSAIATTLRAAHVERSVTQHSATSVSARGDRPPVGTTFVERVIAMRRPLYLFGAGHVGQAIAHHAAALPLRLAWFDTREEFEAVEGMTLTADTDIENCIADAPADAAIVILTHDHALDYRLTRAALTRDAVAFTGLIGSVTKGIRFRRRLARDGVPDAAIARLTSPIGLAGIEGKEPDVIAIATLAQLLQLGRSG